MGSIYYQSSEVATFTSGDIIELNAPADASIKLHTLHVGALTETNDSSIILLAKAGTAGAGGATTGITPTPRGDTGSDAFDGTYREAATTDATSLTDIERRKFSALLPMDIIWTPQTMPFLKPSERIVLNVPTAYALTSTTIVWSWVFEVQGA